MATSVTPRVRRWWTEAEDRILRDEANAQLKEGALKDWGRIATKLPERTNKDCRKRWSKVCNQVNKGVWSPDEDKRLESAIAVYGNKWTHVAAVVGTRHADQCAKRWQHSLDPELDRGEWTPEDDQKLLAAVSVSGRNWKAIGERKFPARSATDIKNRYVILDRRRRHNTQQNASSSSASLISNDEDDERHGSVSSAHKELSAPSPSSDADGDLDFDADDVLAMDACFESLDEHGDLSSHFNGGDPAYMFDPRTGLPLNCTSDSASGTRTTRSPSPSSRTPSSTYTANSSKFSAAALSARLFASAPHSSHTNLDTLAHAPFSATDFVDSVNFANGSDHSPINVASMNWASLNFEHLDKGASAKPNSLEGGDDQLMLDADGMSAEALWPPSNLATFPDSTSLAGIQEWNLSGNLEETDLQSLSIQGGSKPSKTMLVLEDVQPETVSTLVATLLASRREVKMRLYTVQE